CALVARRACAPQEGGPAILGVADGSQPVTLCCGCAEAEVKHRPLRTLGGDGRQECLPHVLSFCHDDNYGWDDGLICGGRMTILADPLLDVPLGRGSHRDYYRRYHQLVEAGLGCTEAVVLEPARGAAVCDRYLFGPQCRQVAQLAAGPAPDVVPANLPALPSRPRPQARGGVAYLPILPRITLLIVGGGHVGQAVAQLAASVDFEVWVADDRDRYASAERF